ncbi:MAG: chemotaxis protein CheW [Terriglobia bacterium]
MFTTAAARLLDRELSSPDLLQCTKRIAADRMAVEPGTKSVLIFRIAKEWFALPTRAFQEVAEQTTLHSLPHHRGGLLRGLVCIRGELLLCASLEKLLGIEREANEGPPYTVGVHRRLLVVNRGDGAFAFAVDEIQGVSTYKPEEMNPLPATFPGTSAHYLLGVLSSNGKSVGCLDDGLLFHAVDKGWV